MDVRTHANILCDREFWNDCFFVFFTNVMPLWDFFHGKWWENWWRYIEFSRTNDKMSETNAFCRDKTNTISIFKTDACVLDFVLEWRKGLYRERERERERERFCWLAVLKLSSLLILFLCWCAFSDFRILFTVKRLNSEKVVYLQKSKVIPGKLRENIVVKKKVRSNRRCFFLFSGFCHRHGFSLTLVSSHYIRDFQLKALTTVWWGCSSVGRASDRHAADVGLIPWYGKGFFS